MKYCLVAACIRNSFYIYCEYGAQNIYEAVTFPKSNWTFQLHADWLNPKQFVYLYKSTLLWDPLLQDTPSTAAPESTSPADTMLPPPDDAEMPGTSVAVLPRASSVASFQWWSSTIASPKWNTRVWGNARKQKWLGWYFDCFQVSYRSSGSYKYLPESDDESVQEVEEESETWFYWIQFVTMGELSHSFIKKHDKTDFLILLPQSFISSKYIYIVYRDRGNIYIDPYIFSLCQKQGNLQSPPKNALKHDCILLQDITPTVLEISDDEIDGSPLDDREHLLQMVQEAVGKLSLCSRLLFPYILFQHACAYSSESIIQTNAHEV